MDVDILEVPLLIEACLVSRLGRVLVCECPLDVVRLRLIDRLGEGADLDGLLGSQVGLGVRRVFADEVLRTDLPLESVFSLIRPLALAWL
jgi:dephospho-CoA kinase